MTRPYEIVYIFDSAMEESHIIDRLDRLHEVLKSPETPEPITAVSHWGKRTLAYAVRGKDVGHYVVVQFEARSDSLAELERLIKLDETILRHLVVVNEGLAPLGAEAQPPDADGSDDEGESDDE